MDAQRLSQVASALGAPARSAIACALLAGTAHTGRELARHVGVAQSTASEHLALLRDAGLVTVEAQGRHRYYRLAGAHVAALLESMMVAADVAPAPTPVLPAGLAFARSCYDHIAGELGVRLYDRLVVVGAIAETPDGVTLTSDGHALLAGLGVTTGGGPGAGSGGVGADVGGVRAAVGGGRRPLVRQCLDWSQRRNHLAGAAAAQLLDTMTARRWLHRNRQRPRELRLSDAGRGALRVHLGLELT